MSRIARPASWERVVAGLGLVLLGLLFAPWYALDLPPGAYAYPDPDATSGVFFFSSGDLDGWGTGRVTSLLVAAFGLLCIFRAFAVRGDDRPGWRVAWNRAVTAAGILLGAWLAARVIWPPEDVLVSAWGLWASLGVLLAILFANGMDSIARR